MATVAHIVRKKVNDLYSVMGSDIDDAEFDKTSRDLSSYLNSPEVQAYLERWTERVSNTAGSSVPEDIFNNFTQALKSRARVNLGLITLVGLKKFGMETQSYRAELEESLIALSSSLAIMDVYEGSRSPEPE